MKIKAILTLLSLPVFLFSCKQCYECDQYIHCYTCTVTYDFSPSQTREGCFETSAIRDSVMAETVSIESSQGNGITCIKSENIITGTFQEVCGGKNKSKEEADELTSQGFICVEK